MNGLDAALSSWVVYYACHFELINLKFSKCKYINKQTYIDFDVCYRRIYYSYHNARCCNVYLCFSLSLFSSFKIMMDTANEAIAIDTSFNTGYLKTSNKTYLPPGTPTNANAFSRPRVIQWDPQMGTDQSTITVVLEQAISDGPSSSNTTPTTTTTTFNNNEIPPMKLVFGRLVVETNQQQQRAPTASPSSTLNSQLVWITLVARVPRFEETQIGHGNQVPLSICVYDGRHSDTATDHWDFGVFTYSNKSGVTAAADSSAAGEGLTDTLQGTYIRTYMYILHCQMFDS